MNYDNDIKITYKLIIRLLYYFYCMIFIKDI